MDGWIMDGRTDRRTAEGEKEFLFLLHQIASSPFPSPARRRATIKYNASQCTMANV